MVVIGPPGTYLYLSHQNPHVVSFLDLSMDVFLHVRNKSIVRHRISDSLFLSLDSGIKLKDPRTYSETVEKSVFLKKAENIQMFPATEASVNK